MRYAVLPLLPIFIATIFPIIYLFMCLARFVGFYKILLLLWYMNIACIRPHSPIFLLFLFDFRGSRNVFDWYVCAKVMAPNRINNILNKAIIKIKKQAKRIKIRITCTATMIFWMPDDAFHMRLFALYWKRKYATYLNLLLWKVTRSAVAIVTSRTKLICDPLESNIQLEKICSFIFNEIRIESNIKMELPLQTKWK